MWRGLIFVPATNPQNPTTVAIVYNSNNELSSEVVKMVSLSNLSEIEFMP
ncbi:hypothetical protein FOCG_03205 [Fusarium oxysporum f. sp. radicis-lycopersici 26381]|uniref:Uncharacterized protein n=1 Tax=Fusarium oxysporum Fo47 TaxID=660027 RepID=W9KAA5_FUSOX|nr:hypothetical protein FOZG_06641 [Fusarium oxysporum Fo47]EXA01630.1 hypothetical protein FOWG_01404 [Fusarium oxysporum f. sp. lycopersici MN25]EXL60313.1 hypothetical protein FOCG_03205 [Fusarium oxysporum f. sp. radicis-lycopersici 26381]